jgi:hypothetical protein
MTKEELAKKLDGVEYRDGIPDELVELARENKLVIAYGASDDLLELDGAIHDEAYLPYDGQAIRFDTEGFIPEWDNLEKELEEEVREYFRRVDDSNLAEITVLENANGYYFSYETDLPHATFEMVEDGEKYCRGIVFELAEVGGF